jgi:hypothetical protein
LPSFQLQQKDLFLMVWCCELQIFLSDRWTRLLYGRGNADPLVHRILGLLKEIKKEL